MNHSQYCLIKGCSKNKAFNIDLTGGIILQARVINVPGHEQERLMSIPDFEVSNDQTPETLSPEKEPYFGDPSIDVDVKNGLKMIGRLPVLILGESGVGKEVVARYLHEHSTASNGELVSLNCASIPESLIESELFGYQGGAFTGASREGRVGKIQQASGGTLFLDEIGDMPVALQTRLLRVLETREVVRLGGSRPEIVQFQLICATHKELPDAISSGTFRQDLFYRISGYEITIKPLRERSDIAGLSERILAVESKGKRSFSQAALNGIARYAWPGNVRELRNAIIYADTLADTGWMIEPKDLPMGISCETPVGDYQESNGAIRATCDEMITDAIERFEGNLTKTAKYLGIARSTLYRKMEKIRSV